METKTEEQIAAVKYMHAVLEHRLAGKLQRPNPDDAELKRIKSAQRYLKEQFAALRRKRQEMRADAVG